MREKQPHGVLGTQNLYHRPNAFLWCSIPSPVVVSITDGDKHVQCGDTWMGQKSVCKYSTVYWPDLELA